MPDWRAADPPGGDRIVPWARLRAAWADMDPSLGTLPARMAHDLLGDQFPPCPACGALPADHTWISLSSPEADWAQGTGEVGWLTLCVPCALQVAYRRDDELTALGQEGCR